MKTKSIILFVLLSVGFLAGCSTARPPRLVYRESQFNSRLEFLRFCNHYELLTYRCE
jgi:hypothetical protein